MTIDLDAVPVLARGVRMRMDPQTRRPILLYPEGVLPLDEPTCAILSLCSGERTVRMIVQSLADEFEAEADVLSRQTVDCLNELRQQLLVECLLAPRPQTMATPALEPAEVGTGALRRPRRQAQRQATEPNVQSGDVEPIVPPAGTRAGTSQRDVPTFAGDAPAKTPATYRPLLLLAEVTYRCPLHCPYCSNPCPISERPELSTKDWIRVLGESAAAGVLHVGFSGGEPLLRKDLAELVVAAHSAGLYTNLITSAIGFSGRRADELKAAGLDSVQISFQSDEEPLADRIAGTNAHRTKLEAARLTRELGFPLTVNVVLHRANISRIEQIIHFAASLGAERLELANTQYYGWAFRNRANLLPTRRQIEQAARVSDDARKHYAGTMDILFVTPDYYTERPKPCMHGWGSRYLTVNSFGDVLPCPTAGEIKELRFDNVQTRSIEWIWRHSEAFNRFRGTEWMPDVCKQCPLHEVDFGGCRCQAALILGDASAVDPACSLSPGRQELVRFVESQQTPPTMEDTEVPPTDYIYRSMAR